MRRGFKAWCERTSIEYRQTLGLADDYYFEPDRLATKLGVHVIAIDKLPSLSEASRKQLTKSDPQSWSAITVVVGATRVTVLNPTHTVSRKRNSLTHELAHVILNHNLAGVGIFEEGLLIQQSCDREQEEEADWLSGALLVPRDMLLKAYLQSPDSAACADLFGVSVKLLEWRLRMTGVLVQARRMRVRQS